MYCPSEGNPVSEENIISCARCKLKALKYTGIRAVTDVLSLVPYQCLLCGYKGKAVGRVADPIPVLIDQVHFLSHELTKKDHSIRQFQEQAEVLLDLHKKKNDLLAEKNESLQLLKAENLKLKKKIDAKERIPNI